MVIEAPPGERVLATVLFADIVNATETLIDLGDAAWVGLLQQYRSVVAHELAATGGRLIRFMDITGDGTLCELPTPSAAVRAARAIVAGAGALGIDLRAAVHVGECERIGTELAGVALHIGARIRSLAGPGEVLVSHAARDLAAVPDLRFEPAGEHELRGVPGRWAVSSVRDAGPRELRALRG